MQVATVMANPPALAGGCSVNRPKNESGLNLRFKHTQIKTSTFPLKIYLPILKTPKNGLKFDF